MAAVSCKAHCSCDVQHLIAKMPSNNTSFNYELDRVRVNENSYVGIQSISIPLTFLHQPKEEVVEILVDNRVVYQHYIKPRFYKDTKEIIHMLNSIFTKLQSTGMKFPVWLYQEQSHGSNTDGMVSTSDIFTDEFWGGTCRVGLRGDLTYGYGQKPHPMWKGSSYHLYISGGLASLIGWSEEYPNMEKWGWPMELSNPQKCKPTSVLAPAINPPDPVMDSFAHIICNAKEYKVDMWGVPISPNPSTSHLYIHTTLIDNSINFEGFEGGVIDVPPNATYGDVINIDYATPRLFKVKNELATRYDDAMQYWGTKTPRFQISIRDDRGEYVKFEDKDVVINFIFKTKEAPTKLAPPSKNE